MPLFDYECQKCGHKQERFSTIAEYKKWGKCEKCGNRTARVFLPGHGGIQCDSANDVSWLKSAEAVIKPEYEMKPWESRKDYKECLKRNNLVPAG